jgi:hypothetical protein
VDAPGHVLDTGGRPITGLYAAGELTGITYKEHKAGTSGLRNAPSLRWALRLRASTRSDGVPSCMCGYCHRSEPSQLSGQGRLQLTPTARNPAG